MAVPYTFANATSAIPLSQLDSNFATAVTIGNVAAQLGNTVSSIGNLTLTNVTISSGTSNGITQSNSVFSNVTINSVASTFPNNYLSNSSVTIGNTAVALGSSATTVGNLTLTNATVSSVSTPLTVAQGGTGLSSTPANGALDIGNGTGFTRTTLTAGSNITITNGAGSISIAATASGGGGKVLQVVQNTKSGATYTTSGTYVSSALFATITPTSSTSKIMMIASSGQVYSQTGGLRLRLYRGTSGEGSGSSIVSDIGFCDIATPNGYVGGTVNWLDSPASTSALTYTVMQKSENASSLVGFCGGAGGTFCSILLLEIAA